MLLANAKAKAKAIIREREQENKGKETGEKKKNEQVRDSGWKRSQKGSTHVWDRATCCGYDMWHG